MSDDVSCVGVGHIVWHAIIRSAVIIGWHHGVVHAVVVGSHITHVADDGGDGVQPIVIIDGIDVKRHIFVWGEKVVQAVFHRNDLWLFVEVGIDAFNDFHVVVINGDHMVVGVVLSTTFGYVVIHHITLCESHVVVRSVLVVGEIVGLCRLLHCHIGELCLFAMAE